MTYRDRKRQFQNLMQRHRGIVFKVVRAYGNNQSEQEELFQEISLQLWESLPGFRGEASKTTWMYKIAFYTALAWVKKERKHQQHLREFSSDQRLLSRTDDYADRQLDWIYRQINQLPVLDRSLMLLWLDGVSYREMSQILGLSESNVGVKINRIKQQLTEELKNKKYEL